MTSGGSGKSSSRASLTQSGSPALDAPANEGLAVVLEDFADQKWIEQRDRVTRGACPVTGATTSTEPSFGSSVRMARSPGA